MAPDTGHRTRAQVRPGGLVRPGIAARSRPSWSSTLARPTTSSSASASDCGELDDLLPEDRKWLVESREAAQGSTPKSSANAPERAPGFILRDRAGCWSSGPRSGPPATVVAAMDDLSDAELTELTGRRAARGARTSATSPASRPVRRRRPPSPSSQAKLRAHKGDAVLADRLADLAPAARAAASASGCRATSRSKPRVARMLERDVARLAAATTSAGDPIGFIERATNGIRARAGAAHPAHRPGADLLRPARTTR